LELLQKAGNEMSYSKKIRGILGVDIQPRHSFGESVKDDPFSFPIIHKQINGDKVYTPLNLDRIWSK
jgi:hypothetical protein